MRTFSHDQHTLPLLTFNYNYLIPTNLSQWPSSLQNKKKKKKKEKRTRNANQALLLQQWIRSLAFQLVVSWLRDRFLTASFRERSSGNEVFDESGCTQSAGQ